MQKDDAESLASQTGSGSHPEQSEEERMDVLSLSPEQLTKMLQGWISLSKIRELLKEQPMEDRQCNARFYYPDGISIGAGDPRELERGMLECEQLVLPTAC